MPPKKGKDGPSKKTEAKKKEKVVEDKTFGMKNKKGNKNQQYIQQVKNQAMGTSQAKIDAQKAEARKKKEAAADDLADLNKLLKPVVNQPKVAKDVDPKSVLCVFFKQGMCGKGAKCKFSHDPSVERKSEKKSLYHDKREESKETNAEWDEETLKEVIGKKHKQPNTTDIVCKYFLEAVESSKYGWFWECPNGGDKCIYRHALPPGYVLQRDRKKMAEQKEDEISLEELIEKERAALSSKDLTKVTLQSFLAWKKRKLREKKEKAEKEEAKKRKENAAGRTAGLSGKDIFTFNPDMANDDDDEADDGVVGNAAAEEDDEEDPEAEPEPTAFEIDEAMFLHIDDEELEQLEDEAAAEPPPPSESAPPPSQPSPPNDDSTDPNVKLKE